MTRQDLFSKAPFECSANGHFSWYVRNGKAIRHNWTADRARSSLVKPIGSLTRPLAGRIILVQQIECRLRYARVLFDAAATIASNPHQTMQGFRYAGISRMCHRPGHDDWRQKGLHRPGIV